jgi:putative intracellular protease/amidase
VCGLDDYDEEDAVALREKRAVDRGGSADQVGVDFARGEIWKPFTVADRDLYTGQNPASAAPLAKELLKVLN